LKKLLCQLNKVGKESFWFCTECLRQPKNPGDPAWLEMSETGVSDNFFTSNLDQILDHLSEAHGYRKSDIDISDTEIYKL